MPRKMNPENFISPQERFARWQERQEKINKLAEWQQEMSREEAQHLRNLGKGGNILKERWAAEANHYLDQLVYTDANDAVRIAVLQDRIKTRERWIRLLKGKELSDG